MRGRSGRGTLFVIGLLFAASALARFSDKLGPSIALAAEGLGGGGAEMPATCAATPSALADALAGREARVLAREVALEERGGALSLAEDVLRGRLEELAAAEADLRKTLALADGAAEADLARLTAVYETMKPKDASALFDAMDERFSAGFLGRMRPDAAAAVLAGMTPEKAYAVSAILAGRNTSVPRR